MDLFEETLMSKLIYLIMQTKTKKKDLKKQQELIHQVYH